MAAASSSLSARVFDAAEPVGFDFTLKFEQTILTILPSALAIAATPLFVYYYVRNPIYVRENTLQRSKLV